MQHPEYDVKHPLEPCKIGNIMNTAHCTACDEVQSLGGDVNVNVVWLQEWADQDWSYHLQIDNDQVVIGIWWQSPLQAELTQQYFDLLVYDNAYNPNNVGYALGIGIGVDGHGYSHNLWYVVHSPENIDLYTWILQSHLQSCENLPEIVASN